MNRIISLIAVIFSLLIIVSCSSNRAFRKDRPLFESSAVISFYRSVADMNDAYFELKENNFFEFSRRLFDSVKNSSYPGRYSRNGDTLYLQFYDKKGEEILGSKALINPNKKEIVFFNNKPGRKNLIFN